MKRSKRKIVYAAISGGVDSAVAAALLKKRGCIVRGIFLHEYDLSLLSKYGDAIHCAQEGDRQSALSVAAALNIPFEEWDFRKEYEREVIHYMVREYKQGRTPNPDMMCNSVIKFGLFLKRALKEDADYIATGHYAKISRFSKLLQAKDQNKDQTYFLATLGQEQLRRCLFPIGNLLKSEVRNKAKEFGLPNWNRKDSQGICFIGKLSMKGFLKQMISQKVGALMTVDEKRVGTHDGAAFFTIGQRHGIGFLGGGKPYYVVGKDIKKNIVYVDHQKPSSPLYQKKLICTDMKWISGTTPEFPFHCVARTRYRQQLQKCTVTSFQTPFLPPHASSSSFQAVTRNLGIARLRLETTKNVYEMTNCLIVTFKKPQRAITPGQFVVFYKGHECLGSGIIHENFLF